MSRRGSIFDSSTGRFASRSKRTPYMMNTDATTSRLIDRTDLEDNYMSEVPSSFPNEQDNYMSGYQHLLASDSYMRVDGANEDEENDIDDPINSDVNNDQNEDCLQTDNGQNSSGNNGPWHSWEKVPSMYKDELFKEFKEDKARISLNQQLARARTKALSKLQTTNIIDCMNNGPIWIQKEDWNTMIQEVWLTDGFQRRSESSKRNRLKQTDGKISSHSGGSVSFAAYRASMNVNETGTFVDNRSKTVVEKYRNEMIAKYGSDRDVHPSFDGEAWCQASGGVSKGRVYGAPRMPKSKVSASASQQSYSVHSTYPSIVIQELKDEFQVKDAVMKNMQRQIDTITNYIANQHGSNIRPEFMSQDMSTPVGTMPSRTMAPMGPTSSTVYRPRPHLLNSGSSASHQKQRKSFPP
uniref:Uncharacterized protein n=1 Tax=Salix viminalis TaxID=40686 RepID=A0A6N2KR78_SALVM